MDLTRCQRREHRRRLVATVGPRRRVSVTRWRHSDDASEVACAPADRRARYAARARPHAARCPGELHEKTLIEHSWAGPCIMRERSSSTTVR
jgi:hypothetical protein